MNEKKISKKVKMDTLKKMIDDIKPLLDNIFNVTYYYGLENELIWKEFRDYLSMYSKEISPSLITSLMLLIMMGLKMS